MHLEQIIDLIHSKEWFQVDNTNEYLSKPDINLKYVIGDWESIPNIADLPANIQPFRNQLVDKMIVESFSKTNVIFSYGSQLLKTVTLYKFHGYLAHNKNELRETFFAKPLNRTIHESVEDEFHKALIHLFNTAETMGFVIHSHPKI